MPESGMAKEATGDSKFDTMMGKITDPKNVKDTVPNADYSNRLNSITPQQRVNQAAHAVTQRDIIENDEHVIGMLIDKLIGGRVGREPYDQYSWDFKGQRFKTPAGNYYKWNASSEMAQFYYVDAHHKPQSFSIAYSMNAGGFDLGEIYHASDSDIPELAKEFGREHPEFKPRARGPIDDLNEFSRDVAETTRDKPFDRMMKTIKTGTKKQATADRREQKRQDQERTRAAIDNMFGSSMNQFKNLKIKEQGVAEGSSQSRLQPGTQVMLWLGPRDMLPNPPRDDKRYWDRGVVVDEPEMMTGSWQVLVKSERKGQSPISPQRVFVLKQQGVAEDMYDTVTFGVDSEKAYNHVMAEFGKAISWRGDDMTAPRKYWAAIQQLAHDAGGAAEETGHEQDVAESGGVGVIKGGRDPRYSTATMGDQNAVNGNTLGQEMQAFGLTGRKNPGATRTQRPVNKNVGKGIHEQRQRELEKMLQNYFK